MRELRSIYEYFSNYTKEQIDEVIGKLTPNEKDLLLLRYGGNLEKPIPNKISKEQAANFYGTLIPKIKKLLSNPDYVYKTKSPRKNKNTSVTKTTVNEVTMPIVTDDDSIVNEVVKPIAVADDSTVKEITKPIVVADDSAVKEITKPIVSGTANAVNELTKENAIKILKLLRTPSFSSLIERLKPKEALVVLLRLGFIDDKCFSVESISQFLDITEDEIYAASKKFIEVYSDYINSFLDEIIEMVSGEEKPKEFIKGTNN